MGYFLRSIADEYDDDGNYIGNSGEGNRWHGVAPASGQPVLVCAACYSPRRRKHASGGTVCAECDCAEQQWSYR